MKDWKNATQDELKAEAERRYIGKNTKSLFEHYFDIINGIQSFTNDGSLWMKGEKCGVKVYDYSTNTWADIIEDEKPTETTAQVGDQVECWDNGINKVRNGSYRGVTLDGKFIVETEQIGLSVWQQIRKVTKPKTDEDVAMQMAVNYLDTPAESEKENLNDLANDFLKAIQYGRETKTN